MFSYTAVQLNLLLADESKAKLAVEIGTTRYCTGYERIEISGNQYIPRAMNIDSLSHGDSALQADLEFDDTDQALVMANYSSPWSGETMTWYFFLYGRSTGWEEIFSIDWGIRDCSWQEGLFKMALSGNTGFRRRAGLSTMSRQCDLKFKGTLCGYSGSDKTCDGTWADCTSKSNTTQFRGFRYAPRIGETINLEGGAAVPFTAPPGSADDAPSFDPWIIGYANHPTGGIHRPSGRTAPVGSPQAEALEGGATQPSGRRGY